jgi:hypothetical protein
MKQIRCSLQIFLFKPRLDWPGLAYKISSQKPELGQPRRMAWPGLSQPWLGLAGFWLEAWASTTLVLAGMIVSQWWTHVELEFHSRFPGHHLGPHFTDIVKDIPSNILIYFKDIVE